MSTIFSLRRRTRSGAATVLLHLVVAILAAVNLVPFAWMICTSVKKQEDIFNFAFLPTGGFSRLTFGNFIELFRRTPMLTWLLNSLFVTSAYTVIVVTLSSLGGFALAKYQFRGKKPLMLVMLATMLLPAQVLLPASYELMYKFGWVNSYLAIIIPGAVSVFGMFLFRQAMTAVSDDLLHAGRMDGCSELRLWWDVALPIVRPMIGAYTLLSFLGAWNSFLWPQVVLQDEARYTVPLGLAGMVGLPTFETHYGVLMAGSLVGIIPVAVLFFLLQRDFIAGLATGAVKG